MKHDFLVSRQPHHFEIQFSGLLVADAIVSVLEEIAWYSVRSGLRGLLWDLRRADLSAYGLKDIKRLKDYDAREADRPPVAMTAELEPRRFRIAGVFGGGADHLILRLWETASPDDAELERQSFADIDDARRWILGS